MNYKVFCLTLCQAVRYERDGIEPNTSNCIALPVDKAHSLVGQEEGHGSKRWVGGNYRFVVDVMPKTWAKKLSGGVAVMQMVRGGRGPINRPLMANAQA